MITVSKRFSDDFEIVTRHYGMKGQEKEDFKEVIRKMMADDSAHCVSWLANTAWVYGDWGERPRPKEGVTPYNLKPIKTVFED